MHIISLSLLLISWESRLEKQQLLLHISNTEEKGKSQTPKNI